ncbi:MAG: Peptide transporter ATP-binding protein [Candidatus Acidoferrum typicum]|nr:Peptide transporter ATP-binding protein [Candidatus Acidoferrum typicum]
MTLLDVRNLTVELPTAAGWIRPVNDISLQLAPAESLGLVGESGSGKTMLALALMGLLPPGARVSGTAVLERGESNARNLAQMNEKEWRSVRGREIAMIFQEPMTSLNPVMRIGAQIEEAISTHEPALSKSQLRSRILDALRQASVPEPETRAEQFPHQLSGGLRQRAMISMAIAARPNLLIADEPTTALDVTVQKQILELLDRLRRELKLGLLFITHDLGVVAQVADRIAVMYAGRIVEQGPVAEVLRAPRHPYTQGLLAASPSLEKRKLRPIPGTVPQLTALPPGCAFEPRCGLRRAECTARVPELRKATESHAARCVLV